MGFIGVKEGLLPETPGSLNASRRPPPSHYHHPILSQNHQSNNCSRKTPTALALEQGVAAYTDSSPKVCNGHTTTIMATIVSMNAYENNASIVLSEKVAAIKVTERDACGNPTDYSETESDVISISWNDLKRQLYSQSQTIAAIRASRTTTFEPRHIIAFLLGAEVDVVATKHEAGEIVEGYTYQHDGYNYQLNIKKFSESAEKMLKEADAMFYDAKSLFV